MFKLLPQKKKTTFVASFCTNVLFTMRELEKCSDEDIIILKTHQCFITFEDNPNRTIIKLKAPHIMDWFRSIYHLATSRMVFVDNYYGFLAVTKFRSGTKCIQLWHAAGAIKKFGLKDLSIENRHPRACKRFRKVYGRFDFVVVGSEKMAVIFRESFDLSAKRILRTGIPRTDFFFDTVAKHEAAKFLIQEFPIIGEKKVILYAPTYRDHRLQAGDLRLDIEKMYEVLSDEYVLFLSLHPKASVSIQNEYPDFVFDASGGVHINHLLVIADVLISDYSSVPFEFSLLNKPMVFFAYDLEEYAQNKGFWEDYEELVPGPVVKTTGELIDVLKNGEYRLEQVRDFANEWNKYSNGKSSKRLINTLYNNT
ncbi:CDP-glycerol glycerophosphotransferase family protein [Virgibacillus byunsanensis]|uniref:CDP-glycerol glycerophosphotransferase family protein n=2 Tax=Virgibacillus byunsanensis TaxID=570945 RepID=A0ABW3LFH0_9BACI